MANLLSSLGGAATVFNAAERGREIERGRRDIEHARRRRLQTEGREDELYGFEKGKRERETERGNIEHQEFKRTTEEEAGAREVAAGAAGDAAGITTLPAAQGDTGTAATLPDDWQAAPARTLAAAGSGAGTEGGTQQQPVGPTKALWLQQAEAQRDYWTKKGRPERAQKVMQDAINGAIAEREATNKFDTLPKIEAMRAKGLSIQDLEQDQQYRDLRRKVAEGDVAAGGLMWGHVLSGNKKAAIDSFNASGVTYPGVQVADIGQSADGKKVYLLDKDGKIAKDKNGRDLIYPRQVLDNLWWQASSSTLKLGKGESIYQTRRDPTGGLTATPVVTAPDPAEKRAAATAATGDDRRWAETLNSARDDAHRYLKDALGLTTNALGQVMKPENMPLFERAQPIVEQELQKARAAGKRMDQVTASDIGQAALKQAREQLAKEKARKPKATAGGWRDLMQ